MAWSVVLAASPVQSPLEGVWVTASKSEITIATCPEGFCGTISKVVVPEDIMAKNRGAISAMKVEDYTDQNNKDPALRSRPIQGLQILTFASGKKPLVYDGQIYNPQDGNTYSGYIEVQDENHIRLNGCVMFNLICKGEEWVRATAEPAPAPAKR